MMKYWLGLMGVLFVSVCYGLVETDNPLLGVLREKDFTVIQDLGVVYAKQPGLPNLIIRDGADSSAYIVTCKLNTMLYSGTYKKGLARFVREHGGDWKGLDLEADPEARFVTIRWSLKTGRNPVAYRQQLDAWKKNVAQLNKEIYRTLDKWGLDPKEVGLSADEPWIAKLGGGVTMELLPVCSG